MKLRDLIEASKGANPAVALLSLLWPWLLGAALCVAYTGTVYFNGRSAGKRVSAAEINDLHAKLSVSQADNARAMSANVNLAASEKKIREALAHCQSENDRLADEGLRAVQEAEAAAAKAESSLAKWQKDFRANKTAACDTALRVMANACVAEDY